MLKFYEITESREDELTDALAVIKDSRKILVSAIGYYKVKYGKLSPALAEVSVMTGIKEESLRVYYYTSKAEVEDEKEKDE